MSKHSKNFINLHLVDNGSPKNDDKKISIMFKKYEKTKQETESEIQSSILSTENSISSADEVNETTFSTNNSRKSSTSELNSLRKGVLFLNKKRKFFKNMLFVKHSDIISNPTLTEDKANKTSNSSKTVSDFVIKVEDLESEIKTENDPVKFEKKKIFNNNYPINEKKDYEMVILFMSNNSNEHQVIIDGDSNENCLTKSKNCITHVVRNPNYFKNKLQQNTFVPNSQESIKSADKTTSTSNLKESLRQVIKRCANTQTISKKENNSSDDDNPDKQINLQLKKWTTQKPIFNSRLISFLKISKSVSNTHLNQPNITTFDQLGLMNVANLKNKKQIDRYYEKSDEGLANKSNEIMLKENNERTISISEPAKNAQANPYNLIGNRIQFFQSFQPCSSSDEDQEKRHNEMMEYGDAQSDQYASFKKNYISVKKSSANSTSNETDFQSFNSHNNHQAGISQLSTNRRQFQYDLISMKNRSKNNKNQEFIDFEPYMYKPTTVTEEKCTTNQNQTCLDLFNNKLLYLDALYWKNMRCLQNNEQPTKPHVLNAENPFNSMNGALQNDDTIKSQINSMYDMRSLHMLDDLYMINDLAFNINQEKEHSESNSLLSNNSKSHTSMVNVINYKNNNLNCNTQSNTSDSSLSRQFKRDYISVRGKRITIESKNNNLNNNTCITYQNNELTDNHAFKFEQIYNELAVHDFKFIRNNLLNDSDTNESKETEDDLYQTQQQETTQGNRLKQQSSKLSVCISEDSSDEGSMMMDIGGSSVKSKTTTDNSQDDEKGSVKLEVKEHKNPKSLEKNKKKKSKKKTSFSRLYSDFSIESKCTSKTYKYSFNHFEK